ncbi:PREDICTED: apoptotic chromatin condensation inducer in the nucleus-like isoform X2 [Lupinus angustifolius]|uniref:apoptotic chromatin condensation inducer in the nucleus-like isoform X2 n=1 Tax=Lupinus angustifolius TaxID=3871 RepID=UPI00092EB203|nr:PREDICTED: apoptotic chromatin condensation inducer in the nucleus-like isoform X2 [Lupinus angustifolius]
MSSKPINQWKVTELREELKRRRLTTTGLKNDLVRRLDDALRAEKEAAEASEKEVNGLESHDNEAELKDSEDAVAADERGNEEKFEAVKENVGLVEPIEREKAEKVLEGVVDDSSKYDKQDDVTIPVDNSASAMDQDVEPTGLPAVVDSSNVGEELITHTTVVETITTTVTESVLTEVVVGGEDSHSAEKKIEDSGTKLENEDLKEYSTDKNNDGSGTKLENEELKLENEESKAQLDNEHSKPRLESDTKPQYDDLLPNSTVPKNQVSEVNPSLLGSQVKSDSIFSDTVSINKKNELKDTIITDNGKLEQDIVRPEMVEEPSSRNKPVYDDSNSIDVGKPHEKKLSVEENSNVLTSPDLNKTNISDDVGYPEKLSLDRSSGDDSMEEDLPESSKVNFDELRDKVESTKVPTVKVENTTVVVGDGQSGGKSDSHQDIDFSPVGLVEKRKFNEQTLDCNNDPAKRQRRWNTDTVKGPNPQGTTPRSTTTPKDGPVSLKRNFSRSDSFATDDAPKERIVPPSQRSPTNSLRIDRFLRPFTLKAVQELLGKTGNVSSFWMDQIKTHCYVTYSSTEEAIETRNAVYNLQWPPNGGRFLLAEYVEPEEVKMKLEPPPSQAPSISSGPAVPPAPPSQPEPSPRQHRELPPPPPTLPPPPPLSKPPPVGIERLPSPPPLPEKADLPTVTLDDLFRKTKATPRIYYLPLSEEEVAAKLAAQGKSSRQ